MFRRPTNLPIGAHESNGTLVTRLRKFSEEFLDIEDGVDVLSLSRNREKVANFEFSRLHFANWSARDGGEDLVIGGTIEAGQIEWSHPKDLSGVEVLEGFRCLAPPTTMGQHLAIVDSSNLGLAGRLRF